MTTVRQTLFAGSIATLALTAGAQAADMPGGWMPAYPKPLQKYSELLSGWYIRADAGYRWNKLGSVETVNPVINQKYGNTFIAGGGFGYKYQWIRADITLDYGVSSKYSGTTSFNTTQPQYTAKIETFSGLANAYLDLGTWSGVTPYIGAGAGISQIRTTAYVDTRLQADPSMPRGSDSKTNFSWAYMAGVAIQLNPSWILDLGYRHIDLGDVRTNSSAGQTTDSTTFKHLSGHEARIGLRFLLD